MTEVERIVDQLNRAFSGDAWHGPNVLNALEGLTASKAAKRPIANAHTIWKIVHHIAAWKSIVRRRLLGDSSDFTPEQDWPPVRKKTKAAWDETLAHLRSSHEELVKTVTAFTEAKLYTPFVGYDTNAYLQIHGVLQHDIYHAGQIILLKKTV